MLKFEIEKPKRVTIPLNLLPIGQFAVTEFGFIAQKVNETHALLWSNSGATPRCMSIGEASCTQRVWYLAEAVIKLVVK